ncbi:MAG: type transport system permease protein [Solirubrobacteraceae bacterium]|jgi:ABC-2 type transport system permease protein|nr:type transport system permease protein [Solirubrobacteraceae bacterium]MEA2240575.1 type transport system permease protein [Solirubrobacteraceae bacterium]
MSAVAAPRAAVRAGRRPGVATVYRWELRKLRSQKRTYLGLGAAALVPLIFIVALLSSSGGPEDVPFGRYVRETGLAIPLVGLLFSSIWLFPLITALVAGDIVAAEDNNGTLKTILTRSTERWQIFTGKLLAAVSYAFLALVIFVAVGLLLGGLIWGFNSLPSLSGTRIGAGRGIVLIGAASLAYFIPMIAIATIAFLLSTVTHNSAGAVVGTLILSFMLQLLAVISGLSFLRPYLLSEQFNAWQGLLREPTDWAPIVHAAWVSACYAVPATLWAFLAFVRRDVAG